MSQKRKLIDQYLVSRKTKINLFFLFISVLIVGTGVGGCKVGNRNSALDPAEAAKELVIKWLSTGIFPEELRELVFASIVKMYY